jgi:thiol-disulfide isomerase/thioredoxin
MAKTVLLFSVLFFSIGAALPQTSRSFEINGFVENKSSGVVFLYCYDEKGNIANSSAEIKDNRFYFKGEIAERAKASLAIGGISKSHFFFMDTGKINVSLKIDTQYITGKTYPGFSVNSLTGSKSQEIWDETLDHFGKISRCEAPDSVKAADYYTAMLLLAQKYPDLYVTREVLLYLNKLSYSQAKEIFDLIPAAKQETPLGVLINKQLARLKETNANTYIFFPAQKDETGKEVTLDNLEFKYLLIDFWASWCGPCRQEHPGLISLYNKYQPSGLEVLSISLDKESDKAKWQQAFRTDKLPWKQVSDLKGFQAEIATHYSLSFVPYNILIDRSGKILATDLRGPDLRKKLKAIFTLSN